MTTVFATNEVAAAHRMLNETYAKMHLTAYGDRHLMRLTQMDLGPVALHRVTFKMSFEVDGLALGRLPVGHILSGHVTYRTGTESIENKPGDVVIACQPDREWQATARDLDGEFTLFDPAIFAQVADTATEPVRFTGYRPISAHAARLWINSHAYVRDNLVRPSGADNPLLAGSVARLLASVALSVFPNNVLREPTAEDRHDAHPTTLRRASTFIEENAGQDISAADIAGAANVTVRTLQLAFRRHLDTTPMAYLRRVRLDQAHHDLGRADPASTTVGAIAARWGFANHSRFTAYYRAAYGRPPSSTLRGEQRAGGFGNALG